MTPAQNSETVQKFAFEGPLSIPQLILLGSLALLVVIIFAWREYKANASWRLLAFLLAPRMAALGIALWMLAGPSIVTMQRQLKAKSIDILVDDSGSMGLIDGVDGSGNTLRWSVKQNFSALEKLDQAIGALHSAQSTVDQLRQHHSAGGDAGQTKELWAQIRESVNSAAEQLGRVNLDSDKTDLESRKELERVSKFLSDGLAKIPSGKTTRQSQEDRVEAMSSLIGGGSRRVERLAQKISAEYEENAAAHDQSALAAELKLSREEKVTTWLAAAENSWLKDLETNARVLRYKFASDVLPVPDNDWRGGLAGQSNLDTRGTDLTAALNQAAQDASQQTVDAVVLVTDGGHNASSDPREAATALRGIPLFVVPIGSTVIPRDVILHHLQCPKAAFKNDTVMIDAMITAYYCQGEPIQVELSSDGVVVSNQVLTASSAVFDGRVTFQWKSGDLGRHVLKVRAIPLPRELSLDNNEAQAEIEIMDDKIRVLLADDLPRWEFRYLSMLFKRDKHVDFDQLLFEPNDESQVAAGFPTDLEGWRKYRVVILGDVTPAQLSPAQQELLRKYVTEDGGNLVVIAGETSMPAAFAGQPLGAMIPSTEAPIDSNEAYNLVVTGEGAVSVPTQLDDDSLASDRIWRETSARLPVYNLSPFSHPKRTSHVLISAVTGQGTDARAFLSWQYVGLGRVIYLSAPITYELRYGIGDLYHHRFWGQLLRWAVAREMTGGSKTVHLLTDKNRYEMGEQAQVVLRLNDNDEAPVAGAKCGVEAIRDGQVVKRIDLHEEPGLTGAYRGTLPDLPAGSITLRAAGATVQSLLAAEGRTEPVEQKLTVDIKGTSEMTQPICNLPLLNQIADAGGGALIPPGALQNALAGLNVTPDTQDTVLSRQPVWDKWGLLWAFMACVTIEWLARRYWRMI